MHRVSNYKPDVSHIGTAAHNNLEKNITQNKHGGGRKTGRVQEEQRCP